MSISVNDLKGFDFSEKYYNPTEEVCIVTEKYEFKTKPHIFESLISGLNYEFKSEYSLFEGFTSEIFPKKILKMLISRMNTDEFKISKLKELFQNQNIDVVKLYYKLSQEYRLYTKIGILKRYGIYIDDITVLDQFFTNIHDNFNENDENTVKILTEKLSKITNIYKPHIYWKIFDYFRINKDFNEKRKFISLNYNIEDDQIINEIINLIEDCIKIHKNYEKKILANEISKYSDSELINLDKLFDELVINHKLNDKHLAYQTILDEFNINCEIEDLINIMDLGTIDQIYHDLDSLNLDALKTELIDDSKNIEFKLVYVKFLQLVNSQHNNYMDKNHYFDSGLADKRIFGVKESNVRFPIDILKEIAISKNHIYEARGVGVLKFKSSVSDIREVLKKYNLKVSGNKQILIDRILENLSIDEINNEFKGKRFLLTEEGEDFLKKFDYYNFKYFQALPYNFTAKDLIIIFEENREYSLESILYALTMHDWIIINDESLFSKNTLDSLNFNINYQRYVLADIFKNEFPKKAIEIYLKGIDNQFDSYKVVELCKIYHKEKNYDEERKIILKYMDKLDNTINFNIISKSDENRIKDILDLLIKKINELEICDNVDFDLDNLKGIILEFNNIKKFTTSKYALLIEEFYDIVDFISNKFYAGDFNFVGEINSDIYRLFFDFQDIVERYSSKFSYKLFIKEYKLLEERLKKLT